MTTTAVQPLRINAYGGGVQSTALLVMAATGRYEVDHFLFCNVGNDSEAPETIDYVRDHAAPYAAANGIDLRILDRTRRDGTTETLFGRLTREGSRSLPIPVRMSNGAPGTRSCTADFKIRVIGKWAKAHGATAENPARIGIGISLDEIHRAGNRKQEPYEQVHYPLLEHDPPLRRMDCHRIITAAGLPVPPKSACWFCPFHTPATWAEMRRDRPELFERAAQLEDLLNKRRAELGKDPVYLTRFGKPLREAIAAAGPMLPMLLADHGDDATCDTGMCFI